MMVQSDDHMDPMLPLPPHSSLFCSRKQREFTPDSKKDNTYWDRRRRNNAAAKRSREKRRLNDMLLEKRVVQLARENHILRAQVTSVYKSYGIRAETLIDMDQVMATLPTEDQLLNIAPCPTRPVSPTPPLSATMIALPSPTSPRHQSPTRLDHDIYRHHFSSSASSTSGPPSIPSVPSPVSSVVSSSAAVAAAAAAVASQVSPASHRSASSPREPLRIVEHLSRDPMEYSREDICGPSAPKRSYLAYMEQDRQSASSSSNVSSSCESGSDEAMNLTTCKSRSRSSSETDPESEELQHHMPHKLRYKYQYQHQDSADKDDY